MIIGAQKYLCSIISRGQNHIRDWDTEREYYAQSHIQEDALCLQDEGRLVLITPRPLFTGSVLVGKF